MIGYIELIYIGDEMLKGYVNEIIACDLYLENYELVEEMGFIMCDFGGFIIGYSLDGVCVMLLCGIEIKLC